MPYVATIGLAIDKRCMTLRQRVMGVIVLKQAMRRILRSFVLNA